MRNWEGLTRRVQRLEETNRQRNHSPILVRQVEDDVDQWEMRDSIDPLRGQVFTLDEVRKIADERRLRSFVLLYADGGIAVEDKNEENG